ncbi:MAG: hypothetical protein ABIQ44_08810, partial [Chloroflexia bacterium]
CELTELPPDVFSSANPLFGSDTMEWLDPKESVSRRGVPGGTGPDAIKAQIEAATKAIQTPREAPRGNELDLAVV